MPDETLFKSLILLSVMLSILRHCDEILQGYLENNCPHKDAYVHMGDKKNLYIK
jgi:hypothetical protein